MNDPRREPGRSDVTPETIRQALQEDLVALRSVTARDLPPLRTPHPAPARPAGAYPGGILMSMLRQLRARPWTATGLAAAVVAIGLLFVPISYQRLTGSLVTLAVTGEELAPRELQRMATELRGILQPGPMRVEAGPTATTISFELDNPSWKEIARIAQAYARGLAERGIDARAEVRPRVETVKGTVYAAAAQVITINIQSEGKSDGEIADEIRQQMAAAGVPDAEVEVKTDGDRREIGIRVMRERGPDDPPEPEETEFQINIDGHTPDPNGINERRVELRLQRTEGTTDEELLEQAREQLREQGVDADVVMENGRVKVIPRD